ncbi:hypothetical protein M758_12G034100 [Ceratodon purpureus]|nr:hypothetical protein M758_12G034100 [Ceratodon purpureus]
MQGTRLGGSLRPCTSLLHASLSHRTSSLPLFHFGNRSLVSSSVFRGENRHGNSEGIIIRKVSEHRVWPRGDAERALGLGLRRHLGVVAAKRSFLTELQSIKDEADAAGPLDFESPLEVVLYPDPRLRAKNKLINVFDEKLQQLVNEMFDIMYKTDGVGLAAPQVGVNVRLMVYNPVGERGKGEEYVLVNPRIVKFGKTRDVFDEGCLSFPVIEGGPDQAPTIEAAVERPKSVRIDAQDIKGKKFSISLKEWQARIFQHEYDHLEGTLYFDRMTPEVLDTIRPELEVRFYHSNIVFYN